MNNNIPEKFLPVGSVVKLKGATKRVMIIGFVGVSTNNDGKNEIHDYTGCIYPIGLVSSNESIFFNHEDIDEIYALGYINEMHKELSDDLKKITSSNDLQNILDQINLQVNKGIEENE